MREDHTINGFYDQRAMARIRERIEGVIEVIEIDGVRQSICPKIDDCDYVVDEMKRVNMNVPQANGYITLICEKYPRACELNKKELKLTR